MLVIPRKSGARFLLAMLAMPASVSLAAQQQDASDPNIIVNGVVPQAPVMIAGPDIKGVISARNGDKMKVTTADGTSKIIAINNATRIKAGGTLFSGNRSKLTADSVLNGLPVTVKTLQPADGQSGAGL